MTVSIEEYGYRSIPGLSLEHDRVHRLAHTFPQLREMLRNWLTEETL